MDKICTIFPVHPIDIYPSPEPVADTAPTVGFAPEYLEYRGCAIRIYDLGGGSKIRPVWNRYFSEVSCVPEVVNGITDGDLLLCEYIKLNYFIYFRSMGLYL